MWPKLFDMCRRMGEFDALDALLRYMVSGALDVFDAVWCGIVFGDDAGTPEFIHGRMADGQALTAPDTGIDPAFFAEVLTAFVPCTVRPTLPRADGVSSWADSVWGVPFVVQGETIGGLVFALGTPDATPDDEMLAFCMTQFGLAVQNRLLSEKLNKHDERLRQVMNVNADAMIVVDQAGRIQAVNSAAQHLFKLPLVELIGLPFGVPVTRGETDIELSHRGPGYVIQVEMRALDIEWQQAPAQLVTLRDMSERDQREVALAQAHNRMLLMRMVDVELTRQLDVDYVVAIALDTAIRLSNAENGLIALMDDGSLRIRQAVGQYQPVSGIPYALEEGVIGRVVERMEAELVLDVVDDPDYIAIIPESRAKMVLPLISQERLLGILNLETSRPDDFSGEAYGFLLLLAGRVAVALDNARLFEVERREHQIEQTLRQAAQSLGETLELGEIMGRILGNLRQVIMFDTASVLQLNDENDTLEILACYGFDNPDLVVGLKFPVTTDNPLQLPLRNRQPLHIVDAAQYDGFVADLVDGVTVRSWLNVPLVLRDDVLGSVTLDRHQVHPFTEHEIDLIKIFATHTAIALGNARSIKRETKRRQVEEMLRTAAEVLSQTLDLDDVLTRIMVQVQTVVPCDTSSVQLLQDDHLEIIAAYGFDDVERVIGQRFSLNELTVQTIMESNEPVHIADVDELPDFVAYKTQNPRINLRTWLGVPLITRREFIGRITLDRWHQVKPFTDSEIELAEAFANHAAIALENARLFEAEQRRRRVEETLLQATRAINETLALDEVLNRIMNQIMTVLPCDTGSVQRVEGDELVIIACYGFDHPEQVIGERFALHDQAIYRDYATYPKPLHVQDVDEHPLLGPYKRGNPAWQCETWLGVPLVAQGEMIGQVTLDRWTPEPFTPDEIALVEAFANHAAIALANAELYRQQEAYSSSLEKSLAEREKLIDELDAFAHTVAHDLKNPLALLMAYSQLLRAEAVDDLSREEIAEFSNEVFMSAEKMHSIIDALLVLSGVRQMGEVTVSWLEMGAIVAEVLHRLKQLIEQVEAEISVPDTWPKVIGYAPWVEEVWANYISNALKYGGEPPRIELGASDLMNGYVHFWVRDNGAGIAPGEHEQLFIPFTRLSQLKKIEGHGLGLSIVQRIVARLGGEVSVESVVGQGSTFGFTLPTGFAIQVK